jgi:hypothetical protein
VVRHHLPVHVRACGGLETGTGDVASSTACACVPPSAARSAVFAHTLSFACAHPPVCACAASSLPVRTGVYGRLGMGEGDADSFCLCVCGHCGVVCLCYHVKRPSVSVDRYPGCTFFNDMSRGSLWLVRFELSLCVLHRHKCS